ncbi:MAG: HAD family hydrolase [Clostridiales bacterium]|nr:HAD family hydrolase [Clostridiales bacterium]
MDTFLFDLDGTLLPMPNQELFIQTYFKILVAKMATYGMGEKSLYESIWAGTKAMIENDGQMSNEERFWNVFSKIHGDEVRKMEPVFEEFYQNEFIVAKETTSIEPLAKECIQLLKDKGYRRVLATNPLFPSVATYRRVKWAGLEPEDFERITTYDNSSYCKPNLNYYREILDAIGKKPEDCIMIGNDVKEDMCAAELGMDTFLLKDCLINTEKGDITGYKQGDFEDLLEFIKSLPSLI